MIGLDRWAQSPVFDPANPGQMVQEHYTGLPGGYSSFYFNRVPTNASALSGALAEAQGVSLGIKLGLVAGLGAILFMVYGKKRRRRRSK